MLEELNVDHGAGYGEYKKVAIITTPSKDVILGEEIDKE